MKSHDLNRCIPHMKVCFFGGKCVSKNGKNTRFRPEIPTGEVKEISGINSEESNVEKYLCVCAVCQCVSSHYPSIIPEKKVLEAETNH